MNKSQLAEKYFKEGYNCAQAVVLAFVDQMGMDKTTALKIASPFGGGLSRLRETCGAVSGMAIAFGAIKGYDVLDDQIKQRNYQTFQALVMEFKKRNGSYICRDLLGEAGDSTSPTPEKRTETYYKKRPCAQMCMDAADILENYLINNKE